MRRNSGMIGQRISTTTDSASGAHDLFDNCNGEIDGRWPIVKKVTTISNSNGTTFPEGSTSTFSITTEGFNNDDVVYWTIANVSGTSLSAADFDLGLSGSITITNNAASVAIKPTPDGLAENNVVKLQIRLGSISGRILNETGNLTVTDAALPTGTDISSSFYEISNRFINSQTYMNSSADYNGPYDVGEVQTDFTGTGRVYIGVKITASTTYYNDIPIAGVQVISGSTLVASWIFNTSTGGSGSGWRTHTNQISGTSTQGFPVTPATASGYAYGTTISETTNVGRFSFRNSTGSSYTGADGGIGDAYKLSADGGTNTLATVGNGTISQNSSTTYYCYRETSGSTRWTGTVMRSPTYSFSGGEYIRVIHALTGPTNYQMDPDDSLYVAVY
tara:strand:+ start:50 stop:1219 length:1170 start_codon:yes stop_codon:yes gene_type:complete